MARFRVEPAQFDVADDEPQRSLLVVSNLDGLEFLDLTLVEPLRSDKRCVEPYKDEFSKELFVS